MTLVNVTLEDDSPPESALDPRHGAFYAIWDAVFDTEPSRLAATAESYVAAWDDRAEEYSQLDTEFLDSGEDLALLTADGFLHLKPE